MPFLVVEKLKVKKYTFDPENKKPLKKFTSYWFIKHISTGKYYKNAYITRPNAARKYSQLTDVINKLDFDFYSMFVDDYIRCIPVGKHRMRERKWKLRSRQSRKRSTKKQKHGQ